MEQEREAEKGREIAKLVNVLRRVARAAGYAAWTRARPDATKFCAAQYNRVLARLGELEPEALKLFAPLAEDASPEVTRMAAHELAAYFGDEGEPRRHRRRGFGRCGFGGRRVWVGWASACGPRW